MRWLFALFLLAAPPAAAQTVVTSPRADAVSVTIYRDPDREMGEEINAGWKDGYALISEARRVSLPAGLVDIRFEGVAGEIFPQSVILSGLPGLPNEKNYDARLLTPGALAGGSIGRQVNVRRRHPVTGKIEDTPAVIMAAPGGIVLKTPQGFEAYHCTGLSESLVYNELPDGLTDKPTLSIRTRLAEPVEATITLSYLAGQFDWDASYVATVKPDGDLDLFAWLTIANDNDESFPDAQLVAVAGEIFESGDEAPGVLSTSIRLNCWPQGSPPPPAPPPPPPPEPERDSDEIIVTGKRIAVDDFASTQVGAVISVQALQEQLSDLKLYRFPESVTVAANSQKQLAFLQQPNIEAERLHRTLINAVDEEEWVPFEVVLRTHNKEKVGLGIPLPMGTVRIYEWADDRPHYVGQDGINNISVDQEVELVVGDSPDVWLSQKSTSGFEDGKGRERRRIDMEVRIYNARPFPIEAEVPIIAQAGEKLSRTSARLTERKGRKTWRVIVPSEGEAVLTYRVTRKRR